MKKLLLTISILAISVNISSAQMAFGFSFKEGFLRMIGLERFIAPKTETIEVKTQIQSEVKIETSSESKGEEKAEVKKATSPEKKVVLPITPTDISNGTKEPVAAATLTLAIPACEVTTQLETKKERTEIQIKKQLGDRNKLVVALEKVASSTDDATSTEAINTAIVRLEKSVDNVVEVENDLIGVIDETLPFTCRIEHEKRVDEGLAEIKVLDVEIAEKSEIVNTLIKQEIKAMLEEIAE